MDNLLKSIFKVVSIILIVIAAIYQIVVFTQGNSPSDSVLNGFFLLAYIAFGLSLFFAIFFPIVQIFANPKDAVRTLIVVIFLIALWFVSYAISDNSFTPTQLEKLETTVQISRMVGAGLIYTYFVFGMAVVAIVYASISSIFK